MFNYQRVEDVFSIIGGHRMSPRQFLPLLGWNCTWQPEPLHPSDKWKQKPGEIPYLHLGTRMHEERARIRRDGVRKTEKTRRKWMYSTFGWWFGTFLFFHIFGIIIPTDFHIFQRGRYTTNQTCSGSMFHPIHTVRWPQGSIGCLAAAPEELLICELDLIQMGYTEFRWVVICCYYIQDISL